MEHIKSAVFNMLEFKCDIDISYEEYDGVKISYNGSKAVIGYNSKTNLARGYFLLAMNLSKGNEPFEICQKMHFEKLGVSLDVSRGGVPTVEAIKTFIVKLASLGYNTLFLYMEDMFELEGYPRFGYMRGRYSLKNLKEIDDFAYELGIEVVPNIEALGHMEQYLQWQEADPIRNSAHGMLVDCEETYTFIEALIKTMKNTFRANRIAVGMDEASDLHKGRYQSIHGNQNPIDVYFKHVDRVVSICDKYNLKAIVDLDTLFRFASKKGAYYDLDIEFPQELIDRVPKNITSYAWTYGIPREIDKEHYGIDNEGYYRIFLGKHAELCSDFLYATGARCWEGFFEDTEYTIRAAVPAMINALKNNFKEVLVTTWGNHGTETNIMKQTPGTLPLFSEHCFRGLDCTMDDIIETSTYLEKISYANRIELMSRLHAGFWDCQNFNKSILYSDILYNLVDHKYDYEKVSTMYKEGIELCHKYMTEDPTGKDYYRFCLTSFEVGIRKLELFENLRKKYSENDMEYLKKAACEYIPDIIKYTKEFYEIFQKNWDETNKAFGGENHQIRLGGVIQRAEYVAGRILKYVNGEISDIEELEQEVLLNPRVTYNHGFRKNTTANIAGIV